MNPQVPTGGSTGHCPVPFARVTLQTMSVAYGPPPRLVGRNSTVPVGVPPPADVTVTLSSVTWPACVVTGALSFGLLIVTLVANFPVVGLFVTLMTAVPDDGLCRALPEYLAVTVFVPGLVNCAEHDVVRRYRLPWHSLRVPSQNVTVPVGFPPVPFSVADSLMFVCVYPVFGPATTVVVASLPPDGAAVAAPAGNAHI